MSFQIPRPASIPGQVKRPGPPGRVPGPQPGARPGLPKPKNPALVGGKPMVPISSLIQFTPYTDPEGASEKQEPESGVSLQKENEKETKLNKELSEDIDESKHKEKQPDDQKVENERFDQDPEGSIQKPAHEKEEKSEDYPPLKESKIETKFGMDMETNPNKNEKAEEKSLIENKKENVRFEGKTLRQEDTTAKHDNEEGIRDKKSDDNEQSALKSEEQLELPPKAEKSSNDAENNAKDPPFSQEESRNMDIPPPDAYSKVKVGPFGIKHDVQESAKKNLKRYNEESGEDQEETGYQSSSPTQTPEMYKAPQEQRGFAVTEEPPMSIGFGMKAKMNLMGEEIESPNGRVTSYTSKESEARREEDTALLARIKVMEVELEKERKEKAAIKSYQERLLKENSELKAQLMSSNSKLEELSKQETDVNSQEIIQKEEQIKRLKADLKSTMEGSRLITEHSNQVISESTKYKLDTEAIIVSLEQEKEELHQKFIDYKRQVQQDYITKAASLQEIVNNLEEKNKEFEKEIERLQADLKQKAQALHKLASLQDNVQDTLSNWPNFEHLYQKPQEEPKISYPEDHSPVFEELEKSPLVEVAQDDETDKNTESQPVIESLNNDKYLQEPDTVLEQGSETYDSKADGVVASRPTILEPEVNTILTVQNDCYYQEQKPSQEIVEESPVAETPTDPEAVQPLEEAWNIEEPLVENTENNQEEQVIEQAWEIQEPVIEDNAYKQDEYQPEQVAEQAWEVQDPLIEDNVYKQEEYQPEYQEGQVAEQGWEVQEPPLEDNAYKQEEYQPEYQEEQVAEQAWEIQEPVIEDSAYKQDEYQPEQVAEQGWEVQEPLLEDHVHKQEEYQPEYQEEQRQEVRDVYENQTFVNTEVPPAQNNAFDVEVAPNTDPEYNVRHEIQGQKVSQDALSAPPNYRLPQKKKKGGAPAPKQFVGFKPTSNAFEMPQEPPVVNTQEDPYQQESYNAVHTNYQESEEKPQEINYQDPEENNIKPPTFYNTTQHKSKPPQFGKTPFGGPNRVQKAQPFYPQNGKQLNHYTNQYDTGIEQQDFNAQPPVHNIDFPVLGEKSTSLGASPQQDSYYDNTAEENGQYESTKSYGQIEQENKYELNGHSLNMQSNGHGQSLPTGRRIPNTKTKVIKKKVPTGSIF